MNEAQQHASGIGREKAAEVGPFRFTLTVLAMLAAFGLVVAAPFALRLSQIAGAAHPGQPAAVSSPVRQCPAIGDPAGPASAGPNRSLPCR